MRRRSVKGSKNSRMPSRPSVLFPLLQQYSQNVLLRHQINRLVLSISNCPIQYALYADGFGVPRRRVSIISGPAEVWLTTSAPRLSPLTKHCTPCNSAQSFFEEP